MPSSSMAIPSAAAGMVIAEVEEASATITRVAAGVITTSTESPSQLPTSQAP